MALIKIKGMSCNHCKMAVEKALSEVPGVSEVAVDLEAGQAEYAESGPVDPEAVKTAITDAGFEAV